jgi:hypothetical protein
VDEEARKHIEDGILRVDNLLQDPSIGLTVVPASLAVARLDNRGAQDVLHLRETLFQRGQSTLNENLASLEGDLGGGASLEFSKLLQGRLEVLADVVEVGLVGTVHVQDGQNQVVLGANAAVGQDGVNDLSDLLLVLLTELENDILVTLGASGE